MNFTEELKELMIKHRVDAIEWNCGSCSDLHGVYDEKMTISFIEKGKESIAIDGSYIDIRNINYFE